jgi:Putative Ig domain
MTKAGMSLQSLVAAATVLVGATMAGCGDDGASSTSSVDSASPSYPINRSPSIPNAGPMIAGVPNTTAVAGQPYTFRPQVSDSLSPTIKFGIQNLPAWARFDSITGTVSGTPTASQVGSYAGIAITMFTGMYKVSLPPFTITVAAANSLAQAVTLSWQAPTENADGTPLVDLKGYKVHYGAKSKSYSSTVQVSNPGLTTYVVQNLAAGQYYFAVTSYNSAGVESSLSPEVATLVD